MIKESSIISSITVGKNAQVYKGILELVSRFGYFSVEEAGYLSGCSRVTAMNRLDYLANRAKLLQKFDSLTRPSKFYSLTHYGQEMVRKLALSDELNHFVPSDYRLFWQNHHRKLIQCFIAFRKVFGSQFAGWVSESQLKKEYTHTRVVDGEFYLIGQQVRSEIENSACIGNSIQVVTPIQLKFWVELELSLKSPARYKNQFRKLADQIYDSFSKVQNVHHLFFLCGSQGILERLKEHAIKQEWGDCVVYFVLAGDFFQKLELTQTIRLQGKNINEGSILGMTGVQ